MKLDDLARRAADEVQEASRAARFTVRVPGSRPPWARPSVGFAAAAAVLAIGVPLLLLYGPWLNPVTEAPVVTTTTVVATTTTATTTASTTTTAAAKTPFVDTRDLVTAYYAASNAEERDAFLALTTDDCTHAVYNVTGRVGQISDEGPCAGHDFAAGPLQGMEVVGALLVSGNVVVVPVAYTYPDPTGVLTGFDLLLVSQVEGGLLVGGAASFQADDRPDLVTDPAEAWALIEASSAAFNADDVEGVLALMTEDAAFWEYVPDVATIQRGTAELREFLTAKLFFTAALTGDLVASGRFFAVTSRHTVEDTGDSYAGTYIFWIVDGKIALQAYAQTA